ncbi:unnamed protein product [Lactuca saligna]|uniref:Secreted protein n=1 Tax=Lactuca saligna TaxID=75948 RepID=A0AA35ZGZ9_LACSI|nr:unnamed protein product [Lactuca saligna]
MQGRKQRDASPLVATTFLLLLICSDHHLAIFEPREASEVLLPLNKRSPNDQATPPSPWPFLLCFYFGHSKCSDSKERDRVDLSLTLISIVSLHSTQGLLLEEGEREQLNFHRSLVLRALAITPAKEGVVDHFEGLE